MRIVTPSTHSLAFAEQIENFGICGNDFASNLLCIATEKKLIIGLIRFPEETESGTFEWERVKDIYHESRCHALCFSPDSSLMVIPKNVTICAAGSDFLIRVFRTDLQNSDTIQKLQGHTSYINDIAWDNYGEHLASVSDDHSCKIWSAETHFESVITFCLSSPGMAVKWHPEEPHKIMVAEKRGVIYLYNVSSQQAIISVETMKYPLMSADWAHHNRFTVAALAVGDILTWDLRRPCKPMDVKQVHEDCGRIIRYCPNNELIASVGRPDITLKVFTTKSTIPLIDTPLKVFGGMSWHHRLPYIGVACDRKLCFWKIKMK